MADPHFAWPANRTVLGTSVKRLDGPEKVTGRGKYVLVSRLSIPAGTAGGSVVVFDAA